MGRLLVGDDRLARVTALGLDEHNFLRGSFTTPTSCVTEFVALSHGRLLDEVQHRTADAVEAWIGGQPAGWRQQITAASIDPYHGYALALRRQLPTRRSWSTTSTSSGCAMRRCVTEVG